MTGFWTLHAPATLAMVLPVHMMPGLDVAAVSRNALAGGRPAGIAAALGNALGASLWIAGAAPGTGAVTSRFPGAGDALRLAGGLVLVWFAWRFLSLSRRASSGDVSGRQGTSRTGAFRDGALAAMLNPKTPLFFAALFGASGIAVASSTDRLGFARVACFLHLAWYAGVALALARIRNMPESKPWLRGGAVVIAMIHAAAGIWAPGG